MPLFTYRQLKEYSEKYSRLYASSEPFPSIVIDNFFELNVFDYIHTCFPSPTSAVWKTPTNSHTISKSVVKRGPTGIKENVLSFNCRSILYQLNSATFHDFLEDLTGIQGLCPDPYFNEVGFHLSQNTGKLDIHADYSHHDRLGLERRLNILIYLNKEWKPEYLGGVGLYSTDLSLVKTIEQIANRFVAFSTSLNSYHGFPVSIILPQSYISKHFGRKSIAMYYYTMPTGRTKHKIIFPEGPDFQLVPTQE